MLFGHLKNTSPNVSFFLLLILITGTPQWGQSMCRSSFLLLAAEEDLEPDIGSSTIRRVAAASGSPRIRPLAGRRRRVAVPSGRRGSPPPPARSGRVRGRVRGIGMNEGTSERVGPVSG